jgi:WD40 repeat protein
VAGPLQHETNAPVGTVPPPVLAFSPDGRKLATCSYDRKQGKALIWDTSTGRLLVPPLVHRGWIGGVDFSPDGRWCATASWDDKGQIWDIGSDDPKTAPSQLEKNIVSVHFSPDGGLLLTASADQSARIWDRRTGQIQVGPLFHANVRSARFSPDGRWFVTTSINGARIWDARTGQPRTDPLQHEGPVTIARYHPGAAWLLTVAQDRNVRLWNAANGQPLTASLKWNGRVAAAEFSGNGAIIAVISPDHSVRVWEGPVWDTEIPDWIGPLAEAVAGQRSGAQGIVEPLPASEFHALRQRILGASQTGAAAYWANRFLSDPAGKRNPAAVPVPLASPQPR